MARTRPPARKPPPPPPGGLTKDDAIVKPSKPWPKPAMPEHQPMAAATQDDALNLEVPETQLDRIERAVADLAEGIARLLKRNAVLD
jgi:hypothetical protein